MKHMGIWYYFVRDVVEYKKVFFNKVDTLKNIADSFTKCVSNKKFC